jgi:sulfur carrier protein ThiS
MVAKSAFPVEVDYHGLSRDAETVTVDEGTTFEEILRERDIHPETVLVYCNDEVVPEEETVPADADVRILRIISGGGPVRGPKRS